MPTEKIQAKGHKNVTARHKTTLEITREDHLTPRGDCIVAVSAERGMVDFSGEFRKLMRDENTELRIKLTCDGLEETVIAHGHPDLTFENPCEMVVRKSDFICGRTLAIRADKASCDLERGFVRKLAEGKDIEIELGVTD